MSRFGLTRSKGAVWLWFALVPLVFFGCNKATSGGGGAKAPRVYVSQSWADLDIKSLAYVGLGSSTGDALSEKAANRVVEGELRGSQDRFILLGTSMGRSRAEKTDQVALFEKVQAVWASDRKVDQFLAVELSDALGVDGLLFADLTEWAEERIAVDQEGTSWSRAGIGLYIYGGEQGLLVWGADRDLRADSIPYQPAPTAGDGASTERNQRSVNRTDSTPEPPDVEEVARELLGELIASFPAR